MSDRLFAVPKEWRDAPISTPRIRSDVCATLRDPEGFWREQAQAHRLDEALHEGEDVSWDPDNLHIKWFEDGTLNVSANCIDRHLPKRAKQTAIIWEGDDPKDSRAITYRRTAPTKSAASPMC